LEDGSNDNDGGFSNRGTLQSSTNENKKDQKKGFLKGIGHMFRFGKHRKDVYPAQTEVVTDYNSWSNDASLKSATLGPSSIISSPSVNSNSSQLHNHHHQNSSSHSQNSHHHHQHQQQQQQQQATKHQHERQSSHERQLSNSNQSPPSYHAPPQQNQQQQQQQQQQMLNGHGNNNNNNSSNSSKISQNDLFNHRYSHYVNYDELQLQIR
jgi:partitioning defective protein 3